jgi:uncharacterized protein YggE
MKKIIALAVLIMITCSAFAQSVDMRRKIEVTGTAEQEITPDIIYISISLQEYMNGKTKITIGQLENELETAVKNAGIVKDDLTVNNISAWNNILEKKKAPDFLAAKQYSLKLSDLNKLDQVLGAIDPKGIQATNIDSYDYSKINELKNELKLKALLSARDKAAFLLNGIGDKLGDALNITETDNSSFPQPVQRMYAMKALNEVNAAPAASDIDFKKIKLSFQVDAVFEIIK